MKERGKGDDGTKRHGRIEGNEREGVSRINDLDSGVYGSAGGSRARCINSNVVDIM